MFPGSKNCFETPVNQNTDPGHDVINQPLLAVEFKLSLAQNIMKVQNALNL